MSNEIRTHKQGGILAISLQRQDKKNALTMGMYQKLTWLLSHADKDDSVVVIHLTGSGDSFCSGNDLHDFINATENADPENHSARSFLLQLHHQRKPIVAAVNGVAIGIGVTMLLHFDFVYSAEEAQFRLPFVDLGLVPEGGSSALLPRMLGHRRAAELLLAGKGFDANEAKAMGIVNDVISLDHLQNYSWSVAETLAKKPPMALQRAKAMMKHNPEQPLEQVIENEIDLFMDCLAGPEAKLSLQAFLMSVR